MFFFFSLEISVFSFKKINEGKEQDLFQEIVFKKSYESLKNKFTIIYECTNYGCCTVEPPYISLAYIRKGYL